MELDPVTELEALVDALELAGVEYALCGGLAMAVHGHPRATVDIDLLVRAEAVPAIMAVAKHCGFDIPARKMIFGLKTGAHREMQRVSKLDPDTGKLLSLDLIVMNDEYEVVWASRVRADTGRRMFSVVSRAGLVTMKRLAGRHQDLADIERLEGTNDDEP